MQPFAPINLPTSLYRSAPAALTKRLLKNLLKSLLPIATIFSIVFISIVFIASPVMAHHAMGGGVPGNFLEGYLAGLAHPVIGVDHFAFIVAVGLLAAIKRQGLWIPSALIGAAMVGTGLHLLGFGLPGVELWVSGSILLFGLLLSIKDSPNTLLIALLAALAGLLHGYAYGEAIFGASMTPLLAYLIGFTTIQLILCAGVYSIGRIVLQNQGMHELPKTMRSAGLVLCGIGVAFFTSQLIDVMLSFSS